MYIKSSAAFHRTASTDTASNKSDICCNKIYGDVFIVSLKRILFRTIIYLYIIKNL